MKLQGERQIKAKNLRNDFKKYKAGLMNESEKEQFYQDYRVVLDYYKSNSLGNSD